MSEELLKAIVQLFAIVARERITEDERTNIKEFLSVHLNKEATTYYLQLFDELAREKIRAQVELETDDETLEFVGDWSMIMKIAKQINEGLTSQQKLIMMLKMIELILADKVITERQSNLIYYIGEVTKISQVVISKIMDFVKAEDVEELDSEDILIIDDGGGSFPEKTHRMTAGEMTGLIAVLRIKSTETYFIKYLGISLITLNGLPMRSRGVSIFPTGSIIRGDKIQPVYYSDVVGQFILSETTSAISFKAENVSYRFKSGDQGLRNINIAEEGGKLIGIMGASGSGKSTLMHVLNGTDSPSEGSVSINGIDIHKCSKDVEGVMGFVPQDDFLMEDLTVYQNLYFAAKLCFSDWTDDQICSHVEKTLKNLGLLEIQDLRVGKPLDKTISGGQRKRLNIGLELLREPTVLYLDEPTSGLSSRDSENIMDLLKELSLRGKMVFVVIHQPSSDIYKMFDSMIILDVGGYQIYYGNPLAAVVYFKDIANMVSRDQGSCPECGSVNVEQVFNIIETKVVNEYGRFTDQRKVTPMEWNGLFNERIKIPDITTVTQPLKVTLKIPNWVNQMKVFFSRDFFSKMRNKQYLVVNLAVAPILALFLAFLVRYYHTIEVEDSVYVFNTNDNIPIFFFMSIIIAIFLGLLVSAEEIINDRKILKRESFLNLSKSSYLCSKILILFGISAIQMLFFVLIGIFVLDIRGFHIAYWLILFTTACFANVAGLNISSAFDSAVTIYIIIPILVIPQMVLSGVVVNFDKFNPILSTMDKVPVVGDMMASRWAFEASMVHQFKNNKFERIFYPLDKQLANSDYKRIYFIPELESRLSDLSNNMVDEEFRNGQEAQKRFRFLKNEIKKELDIFGADIFPEVDQLTPATWDSVVHNRTSEFLRVLRQVYVNEFQKVSKQKDQLIDSLTSTVEGRMRFEYLRNHHQNQAVVDLVRNTNTQYRILEMDYGFVQKTDPIYIRPERPRHLFDYRAKFYTPVKHFAGSYVETFVFNLAMIWFMTIVLYIALYYDVLRKIVLAFNRVPKIGKIRRK